ncbi:nitroreductase/quinone reductase family protein [Mycobacterium sp. NBC_00419]|uniref:nitroreductase family deazaflavin-dependent oxidoreductase n=1 Tax=Mycobacterium sp. NBC_00419 TaxID=2975989 RepID=UPI002E1F524F
MSIHYDQPTMVARCFNTVIRHLAELGVSVAGTRALRVRGRTTGVMRPVVVNVLRVDGVDYVVSPRGNTQWARNARAAGVVEVGPRWRRRTVAVTEVADTAKPALLQRYLDRWYWEVKGHIAGLTPTSPLEEMRTAAPLIPVFALARA